MDSKFSVHGLNHGDQKNIQHTIHEVHHNVKKNYLPSVETRFKWRTWGKIYVQQNTFEGMNDDDDKREIKKIKK